MHGKEIFSLAYNLRLSLEEIVCKLTGRSITGTRYLVYLA